MDEKESKQMCECGHTKGFHFFSRGSAPAYLRECIDNYSMPKKCSCKKFVLKKEKRVGRQHQIHYSTGEGKILCGIKKWQCSDKDKDNVECKLCLRALRRIRR